MSQLRPQRTDWEQIFRFLERAEEKLKAARKILAIDEEACLEQAYEAMLKASIGLLLSHGLRVRSGPGHHVAIIEFVERHLDKKYAGLMAMFDRMRRQRNLALYDAAGFISEKDAEQALETARHYINVIRDEIEKHKPRR